MAVFFELTTDVFKERFDRLGQKSPTVVRAGAPSARRPLRGLEVKEDTFAVLKVIDLLGREIKLYDSGTLEGRSSSYTNFILQAVNEARSEKFQVVETFGDPYIFFYGEAPRFLDCMSVLINSQDFNWQAEFWENYDKYLRGSKCAELGARVYMFYDDKVVEGYMLNASAVNEASNPLMVQLQFKLFLTNYRNISMVGDPRFPIRLGVDVSMAQQGNQTIDPVTGQKNITKLRSLILDNKDEWTGPQPPVEFADTTDETDDLIRAAVEEAAKNYADMNSVDAIADSGLGNGGGSGGGTSSNTYPRASDRVEVDASQCVDWKQDPQTGNRLCVRADGQVLPFFKPPTDDGSGGPPPLPPAYNNPNVPPPPMQQQGWGVDPTSTNNGETPASSAPQTSTAVPNKKGCVVNPQDGKTYCDQEQ